jgi:hypothetical protein
MSPTPLVAPRVRRTGPGRSDIRLANGEVVALFGPAGAFTGEYAPDHLERIRNFSEC